MINSNDFRESINNLGGYYIDGLGTIVAET
jgi:hypothetical protein